MKSKYSTLLLLLATIGCKQEVMAQVKPAYCASSPDSQYCIPRGAMMSTDDTTVVRMTTEEYANLQKLRQAVVDEEKRLAVKYGANLDLFHWYDPCLTLAQGRPCDSGGADVHEEPVDHYTFHGQFLLIDKAEPNTEFPAHWGEEGMNKPKQWGSGISGRLVMPKSTPPPDNAIILNRFPDGSVLKGSR